MDEIFVEYNYKPYPIPKVGIFSINTNKYGHNGWICKEVKHTIIGELDDSYTTEIKPHKSAQWVGDLVIACHTHLPIGIHKSRLVRWVSNEKNKSKKIIQDLIDETAYTSGENSTSGIDNNDLGGHGKKKAFKNYTGSKAAHGLLQFIINHIPLHKDYYELFAGSASVFFNKLPARDNLIMEKDYSQFMQLFKKMTAGQHPVHDCAIKYLSGRLQAKKLNEDRGFTRNDFIYLDPPYPMSARCSGRKYYKQEMTDDDHVLLLSTIVDLDANIMISTRQNDLYSRHLKDWYKKEFVVAGHTGTVKEIIYMNYDISKLPLHEYTYLGDGCTDRQRIKRKVSRFADKLDSLEAKERDLFIQTIITKYPTEVKRFLTMTVNKK